MGGIEEQVVDERIGDDDEDADFSDDIDDTEVGDDSDADNNTVDNGRDGHGVTWHALSKDDDGDETQNELSVAK